MAEGNDVASLFIELGLDLNQLESDFLAADQTVQRNLNRIRNEDTLIRLRTEVEINGLDEAADATRIFEIRSQALNRQMALQRDRIRLTAAALQDLTNRRGENSQETQRMAIRLERERLALQRLEEQLNQITEAQENLNDASEETDFSSLSDLVDGVLNRIPPQARAAAGGIVALGTALIGAGVVSKELVAEWRELQAAAYDLNMPIKEADDLLRRMRLAGTELNDFKGFVRGITDAWVKGEYDDFEMIALRRFDVQIADESGTLKRFDEITEQLYQGYERAKAARQEIEYLQMLGGESGVSDAIQFFERYKEAKEDASKVFVSGIDPDELHEADRALNLLTEQANEFKKASIDIITPATTTAAENLFEIFRAGTSFVSANKYAIQDWGSAIMRSFAQAAGVTPVFELLFGEDEVSGLDAHTRQVLDAGQRLEKAHEDLKKGRQETLNQYSDQRARDMRDEISDLEAEIDHFNNDYDLAIAQAEIWRERAYRQTVMTKDERAAVEEKFTTQIEQIEQERAQAIKEAREDVAAELGTDLDQQLLDFQRRKKDWISAGMDAAEAEILTEKLKADAIEELEEEFSDKLNDLRQSDLEKQLARFDKEKEALVDKGIAEEQAEEYAAEARGKFLDEYRGNLEKEAKGANLSLFEAEQQIGRLEEARAQAIEQFNEVVAQNVDSIWHTALENRLADIEREKQAWIDKGLDEVKATEWAEQAKADAQRNAAMSVLKSQMKEYRAFQKSGYEGLREYQLQQLYKAGITPEDLKMTPEQLQAFQRAQMISQNSLMPNMMSSMDKYLAEQAKWNLPNERFATLTPPILDRENIGNLNAVVGDIDKQIAKAVEGYAGAAAAVEEVTAKFKELSEVMEGEKPETGFSAIEQPTVEVPETPAVTPQVPATPELDTSAMTQPVADITEKFVAMSPALEDLTGKITDLGTVIGEAIENISPVDTAVETPDLTLDTTQTFETFEELVSPMSEVNAQFGDMAGRLNEVTSGLSALVGALNNLQTQPQAQQQPQVVTPPPNINVTVQIEEAHAWDSQHIQELADKVADAIEPELVSAIGGDSNRY